MALKHRILFLCTGNCCRSQMAEAILRHLDPVRFESLSAGSHPAGYVHPVALRTLAAMHIPVIDQDSKSWLAFRDEPVDLLITVCDDAADEVCPVWPQGPPTIHWPLPDPAMHPGPERQQLEFARRVAERLRLKIQRLVQLDWDRCSTAELLPQLEQLAQL